MNDASEMSYAAELIATVNGAGMAGVTPASASGSTSTARTMVDRGEDIKEVFPYPAIWGPQDALAEHHLCFKHPSFAEEQEWRIIKLVDVREEMGLKDHLKMKEQMESSFEGLREMSFVPPPPRTRNPYENAEGLEIRFRRGAIGLVPFVEVPLRERAGVFTNRLPLWAVVQGPTPRSPLANRAAQRGKTSISGPS